MDFPNPRQSFLKPRPKAEAWEMIAEGLENPFPIEPMFVNYILLLYTKWKKISEIGNCTEMLHLKFISTPQGSGKSVSVRLGTLYTKIYALKYTIREHILLPISIVKESKGIPRFSFLNSLESFIFIGDYTVLFVKSSFTIVPIWSASIQRIFFPPGKCGFFLILCGRIFCSRWGKI